MDLSRELLDILACPACKGKITPAADGSALDCRHCRLRYPVREGIPVMLVDEAEKIGEE
ncbi:MAG TPA: Trm112 family protein [Geobacteraceae bacterium]